LRVPSLYALCEACRILVTIICMFFFPFMRGFLRYLSVRYINPQSSQSPKMTGKIVGSAWQWRINEAICVTMTPAGLQWQYLCRNDISNSHLDITPGFSQHATHCFLYCIFYCLFPVTCIFFHLQQFPDQTNVYNTTPAIAPPTESLSSNFLTKPTSTI